MRKTITIYGKNNEYDENISNMKYSLFKHSKWDIDKINGKTADIVICNGDRNHSFIPMEFDDPITQEIINTSKYMSCRNMIRNIMRNMLDNKKVQNDLTCIARLIVHIDKCITYRHKNIPRSLRDFRNLFIHLDELGKTIIYNESTKVILNTRTNRKTTWKKIERDTQLYLNTLKNFF